MTSEDRFSSGKMGLAIVAMLVGIYIALYA